MKINYPHISRRQRPKHRALLVLIGSSITVTTLAAEIVASAITYTRAPFSAFSSQMQDALTGGGKYAKPVWNLHDALKLPDWLSLSGGP